LNKEGLFIDAPFVKDNFPSVIGSKNLNNFQDLALIPIENTLGWV